MSISSGLRKLLIPAPALVSTTIGAPITNRRRHSSYRRIDSGGSHLLSIAVNTALSSVNRSTRVRDVIISS
ncbi:hypothetical protein B0H13DRAFT_2051098 [Mycena leptocephala]|nr:hypothetical protein B0H13DRAFT_2051098 [Mycena leptocephala]